MAIQERQRFERVEIMMVNNDFKKLNIPGGMLQKAEKKGKKAETDLTKTGKKIPFSDWFLVKGKVLRQKEESRKIRSVMYARLLDQYLKVAQRLRRYEG